MLQETREHPSERSTTGVVLGGGLRGYRAATFIFGPIAVDLYRGLDDHCLRPNPRSNAFEHDVDLDLLRSRAAAVSERGGGSCHTGRGVGAGAATKCRQ